MENFLVIKPTISIGPTDRAQLTRGSCHLPSFSLYLFYFCFLLSSSLLPSSFIPLSGSPQILLISFSFSLSQMSQDPIYHYLRLLSSSTPILTVFSLLLTIREIAWRVLPACDARVIVGIVVIRFRAWFEVGDRPILVLLAFLLRNCFVFEIYEIPLVKMNSFVQFLCLEVDHIVMLEFLKMHGSIDDENTLIWDGFYWVLPNYGFW